MGQIVFEAGMFLVTEETHSNIIYGVASLNRGSGRGFLFFIESIQMLLG
jgi:hypothetical protein